MRQNKHEYYCGIAKAVSKRSTCLRRQYGAVVVNNDEIIATGYNGSPRGCINCCDTGKCNRYNDVKWGDRVHTHNDGDYDSCNSVHAEMNALLSAARRDMIGGTLYLYGEENGKEIKCEPCPICKRLIKNSGIKTLVCSSSKTNF